MCTALCHRLPAVGFRHGSHHVGPQHVAVEGLHVVVHAVVEQVDVERAQRALVVAQEGGVLRTEHIGAVAVGVELDAVGYQVAHQVVMEIDHTLVQLYNVGHRVGTVIIAVFLLGLQGKQIDALAHEYGVSQRVALGLAGGLG